MREFERMKPKVTWTKDRKFKHARKAFKKAMILQFNDIYGMDRNDLPTLQNLFAVIGDTSKDTPDKPSLCKKVSA